MTDTLDAAFAAAEAALPEKWNLEMGDRPNGKYWAQAYGPEDKTQRHPNVWGDGDTMASALRALVVALSERPASERHE